MRKSAFVLLSFFVFAWLLELVAPMPAYSTACPVGYTGICATWYGKNFIGRTTASGVKYAEDLVAFAHKCRPFGQIIRVTNLLNGRSVEGPVLDDGPHPDMLGNEKPITLDLTKRAAEIVGMIEQGVVPIDIRTIYTPNNAKVRCPRTT